MSRFSGSSYHSVHNPAMPEKPPSSFVGHLKFTFGIVLHSFLLACHAILVAVARNGHPLHLVRNAWYTESFFYVLDFGPNAAGKVSLTTPASFLHILIHVFPGLSRPLTLVHAKASTSA